jgi:hypothetical protein
MSTPAPSAGNKISKLHCASLIKEHGVNAPIVRYFQNRSHPKAVRNRGYKYRPSVEDLSSLAYVITVVIKMSGIYDMSVMT